MADAFFLGISKTKLNNSIPSKEVEIVGYNLPRLHRSQRVGFACYVKKIYSI